MYCTVITASRSLGIGNGLTYEVGDVDVQLGSHVRVPLRNTLIEGIVIDVIEKQEQEKYDVRAVKELMGKQPLLTEAQLKTVRWMSDHYCCSLRQALSVWLPPPPWSQILPKDIMGYRLKRMDSANVKGKKQQMIVEYLMGHDWISRAALINDTGASTASLLTLRKHGVIEEEKRPEEQEQVVHSGSPIVNLPALTPAQEAAYEFIKRDPRPSLLFGITSSGKTEIYAKLIADAVLAGKQAILLLPEILLTEHFIHRFERLLKSESIVVIHSRLTPAQRRNYWMRIHRGEISLVIGSRSALFAPLKNLGLVILDEEHEWTYKNEQAPRYHARDTAAALCRFAKATLVLGSATPSLESWARAKGGEYHLVRLPDRYGDHPLPSVKIIDLVDVNFGTLYPFSPSLLAAIRERLDRKEQAVLFLNRRGVASSLLCLQCRRRVICPESQLPYTLHHTNQGRPYLLDHTTGTIADVPMQCPHCQSANLKPIGAGTQRLELIIKAALPDARVLRADSDTLVHPSDMRELLRKMRQGEADILLGTQSVVKGLDLPNVTLAAVLIADVGLSLPHFRAGERIFQLLTQLTGRSGRAKPGEVIIQTFRPDAPEITAASKHETEKYLEQELKIRLHSGYPPAARMVRLLTRGEDAASRAKRLHGEVLATILRANNDSKATVAPTFFGGGKEWQVLVRGSDPVSLLKEIDLANVFVDVDPMDTI